MKKSKVLLMALLQVLLLILLCGCNNLNKTSHSPKESSISDYSDNGESDTLERLETLDKFSLEYAFLWLRITESTLGEPEIHPWGDSYAYELYADPLLVSIYPDDDNSDLISIFDIELRQHQVTEEQQMMFEQLCFSSAYHYLDEYHVNKLVSLFDIGPLVDKPETHDDPNVYFTYYTMDDRDIGVLYYFGDRGHIFSIEIFTDTGQVKSVSFRPDIPAYSACQEQMNKELADAGHPIKVSIYKDSTIVRYTGSGEDIYTDFIDVSFSEYGFDAFGMKGGSEEVKDALRIMMNVASQHIDYPLSVEFMDAFWNMKSLVDRPESTWYTNIYGAEFRAFDYSFQITYESNDISMSYSENINGEVGYVIDYLRNYIEIENEAEPIILNDYLMLFFERYPDAQLQYIDEEMSVVSLYDLDSEEPLFNINFHHDSEKQVIHIINMSCRAEYASDPEIEQYFKEITSVLGALCDVGFTEDDILKMYEEPDIVDETMMSAMRFNQGVNILYKYEAGVINFSIQFNLKEDEQILISNENFFASQNVWNGSSVVNGRFKWIDDMELMDYDEAIGDWFYDYIEAVGGSLHISWGGELGQTDDGIHFVQQHVIGDASLDSSHYGMITVLDDNPHFVMAYNENLSELMGLDEGIYCYGATPEVIRQLPICLSMLCDDGMTPTEANELFSLSMEPSKTYTNGTVTVYHPREVVHILTCNTETGGNEYIAMTENDFYSTYGSVEDYLN